MQNIKETSDTLRGPKVNARKHWDGESWILEDAKTRKPLLIGTSSTQSKKPKLRYRALKGNMKPRAESLTAESEKLPSSRQALNPKGRA